MKYVALLRSINVGKHNRITMAALKEALTASGMRSPQTYLQSGNVIFEGEPVDLERHSRCFVDTFDAMKIVSEAIIRSADEMAKIVALDPFGDIDVKDGHKFVLYFRAPVTGEISGSTAKGDIEIIHQTPTELYYVMRPIDGTPGNINPLLKPAKGISATSRNWLVTQELARLANSGAKLR